MATIPPPQAPITHASTCRCWSPAARFAGASISARARRLRIWVRPWRRSLASAASRTAPAFSQRSSHDSVAAKSTRRRRSPRPSMFSAPMTTIRQQLEAREREILAPQAAKSAESRGRLRPEPEDDVRPAFQRDRDRIIHCKAFRRLKHKTQVFFAPTGDHYRTRLTHTLEVSQIARTIAKVLRLHEELTKA